jgi:hypothetical protein
LFSIRPITVHSSAVHRNGTGHTQNNSLVEQAEEALSEMVCEFFEKTGLLENPKFSGKIKHCHMYVKRAKDVGRLEEGRVAQKSV